MRELLQYVRPMKHLLGGSNQIPVTLGLQLFAPSPYSLFISIPLKAWFSSASIYFGIPSRLNLGWGWDVLDYQWLHPFLSIFDAHIPVFDGSNSQIVDYSTSTCLLLKSTITFDGQVHSDNRTTLFLNYR